MELANRTPSKFLLLVFSLVVLFSCIGIVAWQSVECILKYLDNPRATQLSVSNAQYVTQFPAVTICGIPEKTKEERLSDDEKEICESMQKNWWFDGYDFPKCFNQTQLKLCGINK